MRMRALLTAALLLTWTAACTDAPRSEGDAGSSRADWPAHEAEAFSFRHPPHAKVDREGPGMTRIRLIGPDAIPDAEITDGFTFTIGARSLAPGEDAEAFAQARLRQAKEIGEQRAPIERTTVHGLDGYRFRTRTVADTTHLVVPLDGSRVLHIAWSIADPHGRGYDGDVERMLESVTVSDHAGPRRLELALLDTRSGSDGLRRGCDTVAFVERPAPSGAGRAEGLTDSPAAAALRALFALEEERVDGLYNFIATTNDTLQLEGIEISGAVATVRLSGRIRAYQGVCDHPRARIQIEETVRRAAKVDDVVILLNGEETDLQPDARGR